MNNVKIAKLSSNNYRVYTGPYKNINDLKNSYNTVSQLEFENIEFSYKGRQPIINKFNLHISAGKTIGIVGSTGSGKSTIIKLLLRLLDLLQYLLLLKFRYFHHYFL